MIDLAAAFHFFIAQWFLSPKLVAGTTQNNQATVFVFLMQVFQAFKLRRQATFRCGVHDQEGTFPL